MELTINETKYPVIAGHGALILCCERMNIEFYEFSNLFANFDQDKITNQHFKVAAEYLRAAIERGGSTPPELYDMLDWMGSDPKNMTEAFKLMFSGIKPKNSKATKK
jgi:hypothetical protein